MFVSDENIWDYVYVFELHVLSDTPKMCVCVHVMFHVFSNPGLYIVTLIIKLLGLKYIIIKMCHYPGIYMDFIDAVF